MYDASMADGLKRAFAACRATRTKKPTTFAVGRRFRCTREPGKRDQVFDFVIIGPPKHSFGNADYYRKNHKLCRLEVVDHHVPDYRTDGKCCDHCCHGLEQDYSHAHLKKYGVLLPVEDLDGTEGQDRKSYSDTQDRKSYS